VSDQLSVRNQRPDEEAGGPVPPVRVRGNNTALEELTPDRLNQIGIDAVWSATVANRKIPTHLAAGYSSFASADPSEFFQASARSDQNQGQLTASLATFDEGGAIPL
jgi:hypothetical protein